jgi:hypothetical protein
VYVTDMDQIEKSDLSWQFLLRNTAISRPKPTTAVRAVTMINPAFHAVAYESQVRVVRVGFACCCQVRSSGDTVFLLTCKSVITVSCLAITIYALICGSCARVVASNDDFLRHLLSTRSLMMSIISGGVRSTPDTFD